jgi:hypothetical protein
MNRLTLIALVAVLACSKPVPPAVALGACAPAGTQPDSATIASCLQQQYKWSGDSAARAAGHITDSLTLARQRLHDDSIAAAQAEQVLAGANDNTAPVTLKPVDDVALSMLWVGSKKAKLYYRGHCAAARAIKDADRVRFSNYKMAENEGYKRSTVPADSACYTAPGL